jgi:DICT domain-containing protein
MRDELLLQAGLDRYSRMTAVRHTHQAFVCPQLAGQRPSRRPAPTSLGLSLFRHFKGVINLNAKISHCTFKFGVAEQQLYSPRILGSPIDQRRFGPSKGMSTVTCDIQSESLDPRIDDPRVLPCG